MTQHKDLRAELAATLIQRIKENTAPWQQPWEAGEVRAPVNAITGKRYSGVNHQTLMTFSPDPSDPRWCTYKQAEEKGWQVRKGSTGIPIEVWKPYERKRSPEEIEKIKARGITDVEPTERRMAVRYYSVFHASQIDGIPPLERPERNHELEGRPDPRLDVLAQNLGVSVGRGGSRAFYRPSDDHIQMPALEDFHTATGHDTTFLHEMAHATGHESRMQRDLKHAFGSEKYAIEELRAEMSAAMTAASLGIGFDPESQNVEEGREVGNAAAYLASWLRALPEKQRKDIIVQAIKDAQNISEYGSSTF
jgi:antirestriction protein ArdC